MKLTKKNLNEISIGTPLLAEGSYRVRLVKYEISVAKSGKDYLSLIFAIQDEEVIGYEDNKCYPNTNGDMTLFGGFSLGETENYDPDTNLKRLATALGLEELEEFGTEELDQAVAEQTELMVKVKHRPEEGEYRARNEVKSFYAA